MHVSTAEQLASMHTQELLERSRRHFRLAEGRGHVNIGPRLRMALSKGKRRARKQAVLDAAVTAWDNGEVG